LDHIKPFYTILNPFGQFQMVLGTIQNILVGPFWIILNYF